MNAIPFFFFNDKKLHHLRQRRISSQKRRYRRRRGRGRALLPSVNVMKKQANVRIRSSIVRGQSVWLLQAEREIVFVRRPTDKTMGGVFATRRFIAPPPVSKVSLRFGHARGKTTLSCFLTLSRRFATSRLRGYAAYGYTDAVSSVMCRVRPTHSCTLAPCGAVFVTDRL